MSARSMGSRGGVPMVFRVTLLTLLPQAFPGLLAHSVIGRGLRASPPLWSLEIIDIRKFAATPLGRVDDKPAGGGPGMLLRPDCALRALRSVQQDRRPLVYFTPAGEKLTQQIIRDLVFSQEADEGDVAPGLVLFCSRFEGMDARIPLLQPGRELSLGDFVLSGGEAAALAFLDAALRLLPGMLGNDDSRQRESFEGGLLEHAQYTQPRCCEGLEIPEILLSGHHERIETWRRRNALLRTKERRSDLYRHYRARRTGKKDDTA